VSGTLYVVATPIGNLEDLTHRALRVLGEADLIACEDTRHSRILLAHYGIQRPLLSYHRHNEAARGAQILERLAAGQNVALISDAGAPLLADPGARLVREALDAGLPVIPVPGASAAITALMASATEPPVLLLGFLPARASERRRALQDWAPLPASLLLYEAPHRLLAALADMAELLGRERPLVVARELTKRFEQVLRGTVASAQAHFQAHPPKGEFTLILGPGPMSPVPAEPAGPMTRDELKAWARAQGLSRSQAYRRWQQLQGRIKG